MFNNRKNENFVDLAYQGGSDGRRDSQSGWQSFVGILFSNKSILDVGSGLGFSKQRLSKNNNKVTLQEPAPELSADIKEDISFINDSTYDIVTSFDVIEHIPEDVEFLENLFRICREGVFLTTPNFNVFGCKNKYHIREYKPEELSEMVENFSLNVRYFVSQSTSGVGCHEIDKESFLKTMAPALAVLINKK